jgi:DNA-binding MarR family transcriptional regulator
MNLQGLLIEIEEVLSKNILEIKEKTLKDKKFMELNMRQYQCLALIHKLNNPSLSSLSKHLKITKPSVTAIINKLIILKFIKKEQSPDDKRFFHVLLTGQGKNIFNAYNEAYKNLVNGIFKCLNEDEINNFHNYLLKIKNSIKK